MITPLPATTTNHTQQNLRRTADFDMCQVISCNVGHGDAKLFQQSSVFDQVTELQRDVTWPIPRRFRRPPAVPIMPRRRAKALKMREEEAEMSKLHRILTRFCIYGSNWELIYSAQTSGGDRRHSFGRDKP